jgi:hypothetical protein
VPVEKTAVSANKQLIEEEQTVVSEKRQSFEQLNEEVKGQGKGKYKFSGKP